MRWSRCGVLLLLSCCLSLSALSQELPSATSAEAVSVTPGPTCSASSELTAPLYEDSSELSRMAEEYDAMSRALRRYLTEALDLQTDSELSVAESVQQLEASMSILPDLKKTLVSCERRERTLRVTTWAEAATIAALLLALVIK